jgi:hypothetical protein
MRISRAPVYKTAIRSVGVLLFGLSLWVSPAGIAKELSEEEIVAATAEAKAGNVNAQFLLAVWYQDKGETKRSDFWFYQAAERGDEVAQRIVGIGFYDRKDIFQAASWLKKSAQGGDALAQYFLGTMYAEGKAVPFNMKEALVWCYLADAQQVDNPDLRTEIAETVRQMEKELPPEVSAAAKEEAKERSAARLEESVKNFVETRDGEVQLLPVVESEPDS